MTVSMHPGWIESSWCSSMFSMLPGSPGALGLGRTLDSRDSGFYIKASHYPTVSGYVRRINYLGPGLSWAGFSNYSVA